MGGFQYAAKYIRHRLTAGNRHDLHSPFLFELANEVIYGSSDKLLNVPIEALRNILLRSPERINITDLGAGSLISSNKVRHVKSIAEHSIASKSKASFLQRLAHHSKAKTIVELGTSLGITTAYLAKSHPEAKVYTLEGCPETARLASEHFKALELDNIELIIGDFKDSIPQLLQKIDQVDIVLYDGNHQLTPTLDYTELFLPLAKDGSIFIYDDIHWSDEMELAWNQLYNASWHNTSIDLFHYGLLLFNSDLSKEHFKIKF